jgi:hypothetical protein
MLTSANGVEFEQEHQSKIYGFSPANVVSLGSGDANLALTISRLTHEKLRISGNQATVEEIATWYAESFSSVRQKRAEATYLAPLGLTTRSFLSRQRKLQREVVIDLIRKLDREELGVSTIIAGMDGWEPHIYSVGGTDKYGQETSYAWCHDREGFLAIGAGADQFESLFTSSGYDQGWGLFETLLLMYSAKKKAEAVGGVGEFTSMLSFGEGINRAIFSPDPMIQALDRYYKEFEKAAEAKRQKILNKMRTDERLR